MDLTIEGKAYVNGAFQPCCIGIESGKIKIIKKILKSNNHINFGKKLIIPTGIDLHVHFRDPGFTYKEDFSTGSKAALFGGITCVFDMPNTNPSTTNVQTILRKINNANKKSYVDFGIYAGITNNNVDFIEEMAKYCNGFKIFLGSSTDSFAVCLKELKKIFYKISQTNKMVLIHAEDQNCLDKYKIVERSLKDHLNCRPSECEEYAIKYVLNSTDGVPVKLHICHLSSCDGLELLSKKPGNVSVGATPHHLLFDISKLSQKQSFYKVNPPIRTHFDKESLWQGLIDGYIDIIESDHAPHTFDEKDVDFDSSPSGMPGVETMFPIFLAMVKNEKISFSRLANCLCEKPAELTGLSKGKIEVGRDADFNIIDMKNVTKIKSENLHSKCNWSSFEDWPAIFPSDVFIRGNRIIEDNELVSNFGIGKHIM